MCNRIEPLEKLDKNQTLELKAGDSISIIESFEALDTGMMEGRKEAIMRQVTHYYFVLRWDGREIGEKLGVSKSLVYMYLKEFKNRYIRQIKFDIREHKLVFGHMVELLTQTDCRIRQIAEKMIWIDEQVSVLRQRMGKARGLDRKMEIGRVILSLEDRYQSLISQSRMETLMKLQIFVKFGLCDLDIAERIAKESFTGLNAAEKSKAFTIAVIDIIKLEVPDLEVRKRIFSRLANAIRTIIVQNEDLDEDIESNG